LAKLVNAVPLLSAGFESHRALLAAVKANSLGTSEHKM